MEKHPDNRINDPCFRYWLFRKAWAISPPFKQWNYWHIIKDDGGVMPLVPEKLLALYEVDPLSKDEEALKFQASIAEKNKLTIKDILAMREAAIAVLGAMGGKTYSQAYAQAQDFCENPLLAVDIVSIFDRQEYPIEIESESDWEIYLQDAQQERIAMPAIYVLDKEVYKIYGC